MEAGVKVKIELLLSLLLAGGRNDSGIELGPLTGADPLSPEEGEVKEELGAVRVD